jgi:hypothetical protein
MANYEGKARSNYVKFNDKIHHILALFPDLGLIDSSEVKGLSALLSNYSEGTPHCSAIEDFNDDEQKAFTSLGLDPEINPPVFLEIIHLALVDEPDNVFIWVEAGAEKLRYISGSTIAIDAKGTILKKVSLSDIYDDQPTWTVAEY